jgi:hypothetical protein
MLARRVTAPNLLRPHASPLADLSSGSIAIFAAIRPGAAHSGGWLIPLRPPAVLFHVGGLPPADSAEGRAPY